MKQSVLGFDPRPSTNILPKSPFHLLMSRNQNMKQFVKTNDRDHWADARFRCYWAAIFQEFRPGDSEKVAVLFCGFVGFESLCSRYTGIRISTAGASRSGRMAGCDVRCAGMFPMGGARSWLEVIVPVQMSSLWIFSLSQLGDIFRYNSLKKRFSTFSFYFRYLKN